jgi:hypothetical protein
MGKLVEAKAKYQECLKLDQNDKSERDELNYIKSLKVDKKQTD